MKRRTAIAAASAISLAVLGGGVAVAAGSGLFGSPREPGAGRLAPVIDPASVTSPWFDRAAPDPASEPSPGMTSPPDTIAPNRGRAASGDDGGTDGRAADKASHVAEGGDERGDDRGNDRGADDIGADDKGKANQRVDDKGGDDRGDEANEAEHEFEGHDDDD